MKKGGKWKKCQHNAQMVEQTNKISKWCSNGGKKGKNKINGKKEGKTNKMWKNAQMVEKGGIRTIVL